MISPVLPAGKRLLGIVLALSCWAMQPAQAATDASAPAAVSTRARAAATELARVHDAETLGRTQFDSAREAAISLLVRQNLRALDPDNRLGAPSQRTLARQLAGDIRPVVTRAFARIDRQTLSSALIERYARELTPAQSATLLAYYHSPAGRQYLAFSRALDATLSAGLLALGAQPFSFAHATEPADTMARRRALIDMSSAARQLRAQPDGQTRAAAAAGLAGDLLARQCGRQLDSLAARFGPSALKGFADFQRSPAAQAEDRAIRLWSTDLAAIIAPAVQQAGEMLEARRPSWREQAGRLASDAASRP